MFVILIEILLATISLHFFGRKIFHYCHFNTKDCSLTILFSALYIFVLYLAKDTYLGHEVFERFIQQSIARQSLWTLMFYPLIIACSEELFFRLYLSEKTTMWLAALSFTSLHWRPHDFPFLMFPVLFVFAIAQWSLLKKSGSLWSLVITHVIAIYALLFLYR